MRKKRMTDFEYHQFPDGRVWAVPLEISRQRTAPRRESARQEAVARAAPPAPPAAWIEPEAPPSFAARLRAIMDLPAARGRERQALAIVAETTSDATSANIVLRTLPTDAEAQFAHGGSLFPKSSVKLDADADRILAIVRSPEAEGRERSALELATGTALTVEQAIALLGTMPKAEASAVATIEQRAAEIEGFGAAEPYERHQSNADKIKASWAKAFRNANVPVSPRSG
jgi:hypothetical protein